MVFLFLTIFIPFYSNDSLIIIIIIIITIIAGLHGMQLQDKTLVVQRAHVGARALAESSVPSPIAAPSLEDLQNPGVKTILNVQINAAAMLGALISCSKKSSASCVIQVLNLFSREDLVIDDEYLDIIRDVEEEANKYGKVVSLLVPRPRVTGRLIDVENDLPDSSTDPPGVGRVSFPFFLLSSFFFLLSSFFLTSFFRLLLSTNPSKQQKRGSTLLEGANTTGGPLLPLILITTNTWQRISIVEV